MSADLRHRILTSVSAGALAGVLGASGMAAFAAGGGEFRPDVVEGACGPATNVTDVEQPRTVKASAWFGHHRQQAE